MGGGSKEADSKKVDNKVVYSKDIDSGKAVNKKVYGFLVDFTLLIF